MMTDFLGTRIVWRGAREPFGKVNVSPDSTIKNNLRFPSQYHDEETGLHYNYHRHYNPGIGRYMRSDPIGQRGGKNLYQYAFNNPIRMVDPYGLKPGDIYDDKADARIDAAKDSMAKTQAEGGEWGTNIMPASMGRYSYTAPQYIGEGGGAIVVQSQAVEALHSYDNDGSDGFSDDDITQFEAAKDGEGVDGSVVTFSIYANGDTNYTVWSYDVSTGDTDFEASWTK